MKLAVDTHVLIRALVADDKTQARAAVELLEEAKSIAISLHVLCELVWVLERSYGVSRTDIAATIRRLINTENIVLDRPAVEAGLELLGAGGDFADGVIDFEGRRLGADQFVSFDRKAVTALDQLGHSARLLA